MNQLVSRNADRTTAPTPDTQEPAFRKLRRLREDGAMATLLEAQGHGGPVEPDAGPSMPSSLKARGRWRKQVDDAGAAWSRLTENDLQALEDHDHMLAELIQVRYGVTPKEADRQVMAFIEDHVSSGL